MFSDSAKNVVICCAFVLDLLLRDVPDIMIAMGCRVCRCLLCLICCRLLGLTRAQKAGAEHLRAHAHTLKITRKKLHVRKTK